jgi:PAS domain S-box-containing protein
MLRMADDLVPASAQLQAIVGAIDDAVITTDADARITGWNHGAERMFGHTHAEVTGRGFDLIVPEAHADQYRAAVQQARDGDIIRDLDAFYRSKGGELLHVMVVIAPMRGVDGTIAGFTHIVRDVTQRDYAERAARRLAAIVESSDDAIVSKDPTGIVTSWNRAAETMFGYTASEMIGQSIRRLIPADRQREEDTVLEHIRRGERVNHFETLRRRKDGTLVPISLTVSPIHDNKGRVVGASKIARDVTDQKRAENERARLYAEVQEAGRLKDEFLATLSHELRTPLNAILGYARMIRLGLVNGDKLTRAVETVERNASSLNQIVEDILDVSRIISGKLRLHVTPVDLAVVVHDAIEAVIPAATAKDVRIEQQLDPDTGRIAGDPERIQQVIWNLMSNAVKFTPRGGLVRVHLVRADTNVHITVADTGIGIPKEFLPYIFERFSQEDAGTTRERGGLGLGLAIARHLVEMHGGTIQAQSGGVGAGTTFTVSIPLMVTHHDAHVRPHPHGVASTDEPAQVPNLEGIRVLAVDDDRDALRLVKEVIEAAGALAATAHSAAAAIEMIEAVRPDVLIVDIGMPRVDGFQLIAEVRAREDVFRNIPAAALTAYARSEDRTKALRSGFQLHLAKPIDPGELLAAVASLAHRTRVDQEA